MESLSADFILLVVTLLSLVLGVSTQYYRSYRSYSYYYSYYYRYYYYSSGGSVDGATAGIIAGVIIGVAVIAVVVIIIMVKTGKCAVNQTRRNVRPVKTTATVTTMRGTMISIASGSVAPPPAQSYPPPPQPQTYPPPPAYQPYPPPATTNPAFPPPPAAVY